MSHIHASNHPLIAHKISILRNKNIKPKQVRELMHEIGQLLAYEATADLPLKAAEPQQSPLSTYSVVKLAPRIGLVPILRSGLSFVNAVQELLPSARVLHLGIFREKISLQPIEYYNKLPSEPNIDQVIVLEPMIATGGTATAAVSILKDWGIKSTIKFITAVASRQGLDNLHQKHPDVEVFVGVIDEILDSNGYIVPGLGDAGDRLHDTPSA
ncbi:4017_t:CDS:2 [Funneliformis geosporum]|uniref:uracil phosphoribosyltransferase n=1 Tax=Funneliformis geosporum TaxID=1117311 RepID=A0A9W4SKL9_9GLOM|nr:17471_t:CDS:2 [Funneliformis geosporum]CAI2179971.1 4017_t:CDS:2 [Funneliformis geosporum]